MNDDELREFIRAEIRNSDTGRLARRGGPLPAGQKIAAGSSAATWTAAVLSAAVTVPHGLGAAPVYVGIQTTSQLFDFKVTADATNLVVTGYRTDNTAQTGTINFYWVAIG